TRYKTSVTASSFKFEEAYQSYEKGEKLQKTWIKQPLHAGSLLGNPTHQEHQPEFLEEDKLMVNIPEYVDAGNHWAYDHQSDNTIFRLYQNNSLVAESDFAVGQFPIDSELSKYHLELETNSGDEDWSPF